MNTIINLFLFVAFLTLAAFVFIIHKDDYANEKNFEKFVEECDGDVIKTYQRLYCLQKGVIIKIK